MARYNSIRWREEDRKRLSKAVQQFNSKITREIKSGRLNPEYAPPRLNVGELRLDIATRADFNRAIKSAQRIFKPGALKEITTDAGVKTTAYELKEAKLNLSAVNRRRKSELKRLNPTTYKGTMGTIQENNLKPRKINFEKIPESRWSETLDLLNRQSYDSYYETKVLQYKANYIQAIVNIFGVTAGSEKLIELIEDIPAQVLYDAYADDPLIQIDFVYDPIDAANKLSTIYERWEAYQVNEIHR